MADLLVRNAKTSNAAAEEPGEGDILIRDGVIAAIAPRLDAPEGIPEIDAMGHLVTPPFIDSHFHMDATLSYGLPRVNQSGSLLEGIQLWGELKPHLTVDALKQRARSLCHWAIARGTLVIRSHVDVSDPRLLGVQALLDIREEMKPWIDLQLVAFPQDGLLRAQCYDSLTRALDMGVDVVGGIPHFERSMGDGALSVRQLCELAAERGLRVDLHCDESDDPMSRHIETVCLETTRLGLQGRVAASHLTSMHSMDNYYVAKLLPLMVEADIGVIANPLINITLQARHDSYPKRRGMTRVPEQMAAGLTVAFGHDCVLDPWYPLGSHDMLEVAHMALHVAHMTGAVQMQDCFRCVTHHAATILGLEGYGVAPGCRGDLVILQCGDPVEALRLKPARLFVVRGGKVISKTEPVRYQLELGANKVEIDLLRRF